MLKRFRFSSFLMVLGMALAIAAFNNGVFAQAPPRSFAGIALGSSESEVIQKYPDLQPTERVNVFLSLAVIHGKNRAEKDTIALKAKDVDKYNIKVYESRSKGTGAPTQCIFSNNQLIYVYFDVDMQLCKGIEDKITEYKMAKSSRIFTSGLFHTVELYWQGDTVWCVTRFFDGCQIRLFDNKIPKEIALEHNLINKADSEKDRQRGRDLVK